MLSFLKTIGLLEISLLQVIFYSAVWFIDDYFAILLTSVLTAILVAILIISLLSEMIERSRVPKSYFKIMGISIIIPILVAVFFVMVSGVTPF